MPATFGLLAILALIDLELVTALWLKARQPNCDAINDDAGKVARGADPRHALTITGTRRDSR